MKNQKALKAKEEKFKIEEIIAVTSGRGMKDVNSPQVRENLREALKNSTEYKYDEKKSLTENIYEAFPQYKLKELTEEFCTKMNSWAGQDMAFFNTPMHLKFAASRLLIPNELTIEVKESKKDQKAKDSAYPKAKDKYMIDKKSCGLSYDRLFG